LLILGIKPEVGVVLLNIEGHLLDQRVMMGSIPIWTRTLTKVLEVKEAIFREILRELLSGAMHLPIVMMNHFLMIWILVWLIGSSLGGLSLPQTSVTTSVAEAVT
jgi:hypothetical protein